MRELTRREFTTAMAAAAGIESLDKAWKDSAARRGIPAAAAMVANGQTVEYSGAIGAAREDSIFRIFSMTKAVTSVAAMQLVEKGKLKLDEPAARRLPEQEKLQVLEGFDATTGAPRLRPAKTAVTARHLLTHTAGFGYEFTSAEIAMYAAKTGRAGMTDLRKGVLDAPLLFDPGTRWHYGINTDWLGRLVEKVSGQRLGEYFAQHIFEPCGMVDTGFSLPESKWPRVVVLHQREENGKLVESALPPPKQPAYESGGGGLLSTAADYVRFMQIFLNGGRSGKGQVLKTQTVEDMGRNQIGQLSAGRIRSAMPMFSRDCDFHPGFEDKFGLGFLINPVAYEGGRSAESLAWAGAANTYFWIDRRKGKCAVLLMQILPFFDVEAVGVLREFEKGVYAG